MDALDISAATRMNTATTIHLVANDINVNNLTFSIVTHPSNGTATDPDNGTVNLDGDIVTYTPNNNFRGEDSFTYRANNGTTDSSTKTVTIKVFNNYKTVDTVNQLGSTIIGDIGSSDNADTSFGSSVAINEDGTIIAIGGSSYNGQPGPNSGYVKVYQYSGDNWGQLGPDISDLGQGVTQGSFFGTSVALSSSGYILAVGAPGFTPGGGSNNGAVKVYEYNGSTLIWDEIGAFTGVLGSRMGESVSLSSDGKILAIGSPGTSGDGQVDIYNYISGQNWTARGNQNSITLGNAGLSGSSVSLSSDGNIVSIGAPNETVSGLLRRGGTAIYRFNGTGWEILNNVINGTIAGEQLGYSVASSSNGKIVAIGCPSHNNDTGRVKVYEYNGSIWELLPSTPPEINGTSEDDYFGFSVSLSSNGKILAVGAQGGNYVKIYKYNGSSWEFILTIQGQSIQGQSSSFFGTSLNLSSDGTRLIVGAPDESGELGNVRVYNLVDIVPINIYLLRIYSYDKINRQLGSMIFRLVNGTIETGANLAAKVPINRQPSEEFITDEIGGVATAIILSYNGINRKRDVISQKQSRINITNPDQLLDRGRLTTINSFGTLTGTDILGNPSVQTKYLESGITTVENVNGNNLGTITSGNNSVYLTNTNFNLENLKYPGDSADPNTTIIDSIFNVGSTTSTTSAGFEELTSFGNTNTVGQIALNSGVFANDHPELSRINFGVPLSWDQNRESTRVEPADTSGDTSIFDEENSEIILAYFIAAPKKDGDGNIIANESIGFLENLVGENTNGDIVIVNQHLFSVIHKGIPNLTTIRFNNPSLSDLGNLTSSNLFDNVSDADLANHSILFTVTNREVEYKIVLRQLERDSNTDLLKFDEIEVVSSNPEQETINLTNLKVNIHNNPGSIELIEELENIESVNTNNITQGMNSLPHPDDPNDPNDPNRIRNRSSYRGFPDADPNKFTRYLSGKHMGTITSSLSGGRMINTFASISTISEDKVKLPFFLTVCCGDDEDTETPDAISYIDTPLSRNFNTNYSNSADFIVSKFVTLCFHEKTLIPRPNKTTTQIKYLKKNDLVVCKDGIFPISKIIKSKINEPFVKISKNCFGSIPESDIYITKPHEISLGLYKNIEIFNGKYNPEYEDYIYLYIAARDLCVLDGVDLVYCDDSQYVYNLVFDHQKSINISGLDVTTHHPKNDPILEKNEYFNPKNYNNKKRKEIFFTINGLLKLKPDDLDNNEFILKCLSYNNKYLFKNLPYSEIKDINS